MGGLGLAGLWVCTGWSLIGWVNKGESNAALWGAAGRALKGVFHPVPAA
jgi:hypothetical protein